MQDCITHNLKPTIRFWEGKQVVKKKKRVESMRMLYALPTHLVVGNKTRPYTLRVPFHGVMESCTAARLDSYLTQFSLSWAGRFFASCKQKHVRQVAIEVDEFVVLVRCVDSVTQVVHESHAGPTQPVHYV